MQPRFHENHMGKSYHIRDKVLRGDFLVVGIKNDLFFLDVFWFFSPVFLFITININSFCNQKK